MSTEAIAEKVKFVPLYVHDGAKEKDNGGYTGTLSIITMPHYANGVKNIGDIHPYGGEGFPDYEEAKVYAKLFAASPQLLEYAKCSLLFEKEGWFTLGSGEYKYTGNEAKMVLDDLRKKAIVKATTL